MEIDAVIESEELLISPLFGVECSFLVEPENSN
jgi:hypothetical protein